MKIDIPNATTFGIQVEIFFDFFAIDSIFKTFESCKLEIFQYSIHGGDINKIF